MFVFYKHKYNKLLVYDSNNNIFYFHKKSKGKKLSQNFQCGQEQTIRKYTIT